MTDRPLCVLVADDDEATARLYAAYGTARGHRVVVARDGLEALAAAEREAPDVVMLDIALPKLDGRDVCRRLKADPRTREIPVLVVTASGDDQVLRDELVDLGADDVLEKPIDLVIAFRKLQRIVERIAPSP